MVDPGEDFQGYMEGVAHVEAEREATRELLRQHEEWRQTTWSGWAVRQIQSTVKGLEPTVSQIASTFGEENSNDASSAIIVNLIRFLAIMVVIVGFYALSQIVNNFLGKEIVMEEEIVILHEYETEEEARAAKKENAGPAAIAAAAAAARGKTDKGNKDD